MQTFSVHSPSANRYGEGYQPLRLVVGPFPFVEDPVLEPIAIFSGSFPISAAWPAVAGLFQ